MITLMFEHPEFGDQRHATTTLLACSMKMKVDHEGNEDDLVSI